MRFLKLDLLIPADGLGDKSPTLTTVGTIFLKGNEYGQGNLLPLLFRYPYSAAANVKACSSRAKVFPLPNSPTSKKLFPLLV